MTYFTPNDNKDTREKKKSSLPMSNNEDIEHVLLKAQNNSGTVICFLETATYSLSRCLSRTL